VKSSNETLHFYSVAQLRRFVRPRGIESALDVMRDKYEDGDVRIEVGDIVIDVGANIGEFSLTAFRQGASVVIGIEPDDSAFQCLSLNLGSFDSVELHKLGLGDREGVMDFFVASESNDSSFIRPPRHTAIKSVPVKTLDTLVKESKLPRIDFLKIEGEGMEPEILSGAAAALERTRKVAVDVSPERHGVSPVRECKAVLSAHGFQTWMRGMVLFATKRD
jgi:FkbM family methyltransferase